jgi:putative chitinase
LEDYKGNSMITLEILKALCPKTKETVLKKYATALHEVAEYYDMYDNHKRAAAFLAQTAHESGGFNFVKENLNYSAKGLVGTFKKYFKDEATAKAYERQPEKIANRVYASRMANGDEASGDGYRFCGRGLIQLTGRANYTKFAEDLGISVEETVNYLETPEGAVSSAGWFWDNNDLNKFCDNDDFVGLTKRINGGTIGIEDRKHHYELALKLLG